MIDSSQFNDRPITKDFYQILPNFSIDIGSKMNFMLFIFKHLLPISNQRKQTIVSLLLIAFPYKAISRIITTEDTIFNPKQMF